MKQFLLSAPPDRDGLVRISGEDFHYLVHVRRLKAGDRFNARLPDPGGGSFPLPGTPVLLELRSLGQGVLTAAVLGEVPDSVPLLPPILLFQALPKGSRMDLIVRQAAEGGIHEIVPFAAEYSIIKSGDLRDGGEKPRRWGRIIREALQQSGSPVPTSLHRPLDADGLFAYWEELKAARPRALGIFLHQESEDWGSPAPPLAERSFHRYLSTIPEILALAIGPEGGFSPAEALRFLKADFKPLAIGDTVLRTETAALYGAAAARVILLERETWIQKLR
ncbi:MAG: RsmE family RNA methyltransferase [Treponema sp.]|nr:RsmE family RNA methyltransferase [Treponema sp.]